METASRTPSDSISYPSEESSFFSLRMDILPVIGLLALVCLFYWPVLTGQAFLWNDFPERIYPMRLFASIELVSGRIPFWNPFIFGGIPFAAMIDNAVFYPPNWLFLLGVDGEKLSFLFVEWLTLFHVFLLGLGMYFFCRRLEMNRTGAFASALIWMFSGPITYHVFHGEMLHTIAWLPWILFFLIPALHRLSLNHAIAAGCAWGLAIAAGHPQIFLYVGYIMVLYGMFRMIESVRANGLNREVTKVTSLLGLSLGIGLGLSALALLPAFEMAGYSFRQVEWTGNSSESYAIAPRQLITLLIPDFFGRSDAVESSYWGPGAESYGFYWETYWYLGILPLLLAGLGLFRSPKRQRMIWGGIILLSFGLCLGNALPPFSFLREQLPGFGLFRAHGRLSMIFAFAVAVLAGFGMDYLRKVAGRPMRSYKPAMVVLCLISAFFLFLIVVGPNRVFDLMGGGPDNRALVSAAFGSQGIGALLIGVLSLLALVCWRFSALRTAVPTAVTLTVILVDLFMANRDFNLGPEGIEAYYPLEPVVKALQEQHQIDGTRFSLRSGSYGIVKRNAGTVFRFETLEGVISALRLGETFPPAPLGQVFDLMNVSLYMKVLEETKSAKLERNTDLLPRAFIVRDYIVTDSSTKVRSVLSDPAFNYRTTVTVDQKPPFPVSVVLPDSTDSVRTVSSEPNRKSYAVKVSKPGLLVMSEVYYPEWNAYVDGQKTPVYRVDGTLRGIPIIKTGVSFVEVKYESWLFRTGSVLSCLTLAGILVYVFANRSKPPFHHRTWLSK